MVEVSSSACTPLIATATWSVAGLNSPVAAPPSARAGAPTAPGGSRSAPPAGPARAKVSQPVAVATISVLRPASKATDVAPSMVSDPARVRVITPVPPLRTMACQPGPAAATVGRVSAQVPLASTSTPRLAMVRVVAAVRVRIAPNGMPSSAAASATVPPVPSRLDR